MPDYLFRDNNFYNWRDDLLRAEINRFAGMNLNALEGPAIGHLIESAGNGPIFDVPTLILDKRRGVAANSVMDVHIPFAGNASLFRVIPTSSIQISKKANVLRDEIIVQFPDSDRIGSDLSEFIEAVQQNLSSLRNNIEEFKPELRQRIQGTVARRIAELKALAQKDQGLGFPVSRS